MWNDCFTEEEQGGSSLKPSLRNEDRCTNNEEVPVDEVAAKAVKRGWSMVAAGLRFTNDSGNGAMHEHSSSGEQHSIAEDGQEHDVNRAMLWCCGKHPAKTESPARPCGVTPWSAGGCRVGASPHSMSSKRRSQKRTSTGVVMTARLIRLIR